jgi:chromate transporter
MALSYVYAAYGNVPVIVALFFGLKAAVLAIVLEAVFRIGKRSLKNNTMRLLAAAAFVGIFFFNIPFPIIILSAALIGFFGAWSGATAFQLKSGHGDGKKEGAPVESLLGDELPEHARPTVARALRASSIWLALWLVPVILLLITLGRANVLSEIAVFFSKMAVVTFGGAYAVLAYVAQQAVENYGWLKPGEMLDGLGMAETTPGPLIMVLQFVGFMAAYRDPGALSPMLAGTLGGLLATWVTFIRRAFNDHGGSGGSGPQSRDLVCAAYDISRGPGGARVWFRIRHAGAGERGPLGAGAVDRGDRRDLPLQAGNDHDTAGVFRSRDRTPFRRPCCMNSWN